jgi:hypothetical protein
MPDDSVTFAFPYRAVVLPVRVGVVFGWITITAAFWCFPFTGLPQVNGAFTVLDVAFVAHTAARADSLYSPPPCLLLLVCALGLRFALPLPASLYTCRYLGALVTTRTVQFMLLLV